MTALLSEAPPVATRPVPWHRMGWVAWRRFRPTLLGVAVLVGALSAYLAVVGSQARAAYDKVAECRPPAADAGCQFRWADFVNQYGDRGIIGAAVLMLPGIIGAFVGAPLLARELETGVVRYSWTQGVGRMRWAIGLIVPAAVVTTLVPYALGLLVTWRNQPLIDGGMSHRLDPSLFPTIGVAVAGWALLGFSIGVLSGLLWRRVVPAIGTAFAVWFGLAYLASKIRLTWPGPLTTTQEPKLGDLDIDQWWTHNGVRVGYTEINAVLESIGAQIEKDSVRMRAGGTDPLEYLQAHGYTTVHSYQPDSRFWAFQWTELGVLVAVSLVLLGLSVWLLRRLSV